MQTGKRRNEISSRTKTYRKKKTTPGNTYSFPVDTQGLLSAWQTGKLSGRLLDAQDEITNFSLIL